MAGRFGVQTPVANESFRTHPDQPRGPPTLLHNEYGVSLLEMGRPPLASIALLRLGASGGMLRSELYLTCYN